MSDGYCGACENYSYVKRYGRAGWQFGYCQNTTCIRTWERKKRRHAGKHRKYEEECASRNMSPDQIGIGSSDWQEQQQWAAAGFGDIDINAVHHWKKNSWTPWTWHGWVDYQSDWPQWNQGHQWSEANGDCSRGSQPWSRTSWKTAIDATNTKKRWGAWAAGVVAISMRSREHCVCLVEKYDGQLGFPKGGAEEAEEFMPDGGHMATAMREWQEETNLQTEGLTLMDARAGLHVDKFNCHYFMAKWDPTWLPALPAGFIQPFFHPEMGVGTSWEITDDPEIVRAHWMDCSTALARLSRTRGQILCETVQYLIKKQADKESPVQTCP